MNQSTNNLDGISGPSGECLCDHCQHQHSLDGISDSSYDKPDNTQVKHVDLQNKDQTRKVPVYAMAA